MDVKKGIRVVEKKPVHTYTVEISNANTLEVEVGTNGLRGGNRSHGSRTYFRLKDLCCTSMKIHVLSEGGLEGGEFEVELCGDTELETFIEALRFATNVLQDIKNGGTE